MLKREQIRTDADLARDGMNKQDITEFNDMRERYFNEFIPKFEKATADKNWDLILDLEAAQRDVEFRLLYLGKNPKEVPIAAIKDMLYEDHADPYVKASFRRIKNPGTAIRAKCMWCMSGQSAEIARCLAVTCTLWPFRMGDNPFYNKTLPPVRDIVLEDDDDIVIEEDASEGRSDAD